MSEHTETREQASNTKMGSSFLLKPDPTNKLRGIITKPRNTDTMRRDTAAMDMSLMGFWSLRLIRDGCLLRSEREGGNVLLVTVLIAAMSANVNLGVGKEDLQDSTQLLRSRHMPGYGQFLVDVV
jgi:hypothetical protein